MRLVWYDGFIDDMERLFGSLRNSKLVRRFREWFGDMKPLYIYLHIPRSAGACVLHRLQGFLGTGQIIRAGYNLLPDVRMDKPEKLLPIGKIREGIEAQGIENPAVIFGHQIYNGIHELFPGRTPIYLTALRHPADRVISSYTYGLCVPDDIYIRKTVHPEGNDPIPFERWLDLNWYYGNNFVTRFLLERSFIEPRDSMRLTEFDLVAAMNRFTKIGIVERFEDFDLYLRRTKLIGNGGGLLPRNQSRITSAIRPIGELADKIETDNSVDAHLYSIALKMNGMEE